MGGVATRLPERSRAARPDARRDGDVPAAMQAFDQARAIITRLYGPRNATVGDIDFYAAEAASKAGDTDAALALLAETKVIYDAAYGPDDPDQVELLQLRARVLAHGGRLVDARRDCAAALVLKTKLGPHDPGLAEARAQCDALGASGTAT